jgi:hypothetical protein
MKLISHFAGRPAATEQARELLARLKDWAPHEDVSPAVSVLGLLTELLKVCLSSMRSRVVRAPKSCQWVSHEASRFTHKMQLDGFTRRITRVDACRAVDVWWSGAKLVQPLVTCGSAGVGRACQIQATFDTERSQLVLSRRKRPLPLEIAEQRLAWASGWHTRLGAGAFTGGLPADLLDAVAAHVHPPWRPAPAPPQRPPQSLARVSQEDLILDRHAFALLVHTAVAQSPLWYRYRVRPDALFVLQCAVEAAIILRLRVLSAALA